MVDLGEIFEYSSAGTSTVKEVAGFFNNRKVTEIEGFTQHGIHSLYADKNGDAMIVEASDKGSEITKIKDRFIVMTNFPVYKFSDKNYKEVKGDGADRYKTAYEYILENKDVFNRDHAFETR